MSLFSLLFYGLLILLILSFFSSFIFIVHQETASVIERLGKFHNIRQAGLHFKIPIIDNIVGKLTLKIQQLDILVDTKTKDNVFVKVKISVQFKVIENKVYEAFYKLDNSNTQITSYIFDVVRAEVPKMRLDDVFERKDYIAIAVKRELEESMLDYGYSIIKALVTDLDPDDQVKQAMNRINTAEREKVAAEYKAESERIQIVAKAKAEAESKKLQGKGTADQRREIARGILESVEVLNNVGINSQEASALIVVTQHYDTLQSMGESSNTNLILLPNSPGAANDMLNNMITSFNISNQIGESIKKKNESKNSKKNK
ncbi:MULTISPECIES: SPFH domain-containing protein [Blattabacterium]|uniref:SPFH domain-containing protein n=1 Tax=Blattabacterium TaxID=34098 RepID=UPI00023871CF|nr:MULTISPECIES: SPFH domain-containing protein [Blattabacterium]AEU09582.1 SPFH domain/band 7 family protein [Blattabacterium sp. (Cryptocercus punctulatus) str. Cpu]AWU44508.1 SPFH domain-containing protein [Blattabacterium punctulatus]AWU45593.1 SPFH domain-containing protein [Blattabacterium punctulatus]